MQTSLETATFTSSKQIVCATPPCRYCCQVAMRMRTTFSGENGSWSSSHPACWDLVTSLRACTWITTETEFSWSYSVHTSLELLSFYPHRTSLFPSVNLFLYSSVGSDNHTITSASDKRFGLADMPEWICTGILPIISHQRFEPIRHQGLA